MNLSSHLRFADTRPKFEFNIGRNCSCPLKLKVLNTLGLEEFFFQILYIYSTNDIVAYEAVELLLRLLCEGQYFLKSRFRLDPDSIDSVNSDPGRQTCSTKKEIFLNLTVLRDGGFSCSLKGLHGDPIRVFWVQNFFFK